MVISQPFVIQPEELPVWIRDICSYHSAAGSHKRAGTRRYFSAGARGSAARILIDSSRIRAPTPTILIYLTSVNHFRSNDVKNSPLLTVVFDIEIHAIMTHAYNMQLKMEWNLSVDYQGKRTSPSHPTSCGVFTRSTDPCCHQDII